MKKEKFIKRSELIKKCEQFIKQKINKEDIAAYASNLIAQDFFESGDEVIADIITQWDNEEMNFPINAVNMRLWKHRLETEEDLLPEYNSWNVHLEKQKEVCRKNGSIWKPINRTLMIGCSDSILSDPINGLRHPKEGNTTGWYIWGGDYSEAEDFFKPICAEHLLQVRPQIVNYLGLDVGFRFLADSNGYEDVWYDENLKKLE